MKYALILLFFFSGLAFAGGSQTTCKNPVTQTDMNICAYQKAKATKLKLKSFIAAYLKRLGPGDQARLFKKAEAAWLVYRDAYCEFKSSASVGGSVHPMVVSACQAKMVRERLHELQALSRCREGDLGCPLPSVAQLPN